LGKKWIETPKGQAQLPEIYEALKQWQIARQESAKGRPTKKDRRAIDQDKESWEWDS